MQMRWQHLWGTVVQGSYIKLCNITSLLTTCTITRTSMGAVVPGSSTAAWRSWYTWSFIGSMYPSVSSINSAWSRDAVWTVLLPSTWLLTAFQSLQLNQRNICVLLPVISWLCRHIDWVPTDVRPSLLLVRRCGTLYWNNCVILFTPPPSLVVYWRHFFLPRDALVHSAVLRLHVVCPSVCLWRWCIRIT